MRQAELAFREVRIPRYSGARTASGYFDDPAALAAAVEPWDSRGNVYLTLNPVQPALLARAANRMKENVTSTTADTDIVVASAKAYITALNKLHSKLERLNPQV